MAKRKIIIKLENERQTLLRGVKPLSIREQLEAAARKPLAGGAQPVGGLFGDAHLQRDLF